MKRFVALVSLSTALAIGTTSCAYSQLTKRKAVEGAATAAVIASLVLLAANNNCSDCNIGAEHAALPPR